MSDRPYGICGMLHGMDPIPLSPTTLSNSPSLLLHRTINSMMIPFYSQPHHHHRMIPSLRDSPSLPVQPIFRSPKITCSAILGGGNGRRREERRRRKAIGSAGISALRQAFSLATSFRRLWPPTEPLDMLLLFQNGGNGGSGGGRRGFWSGGGRWPERRMPWKEGGLVGLLVSMAITAAVFVLGRTGVKDSGIGVLVPALLGLKRRRIWRKEVGVLILGFAFCFLFWKVVGRRRKNGWRWIPSFACRF